MHQISFGGRAPGLKRSPRSPSCIKGCLLLREEKGGEERDRGEDGWGGDEEGMGKDEGVRREEGVEREGEYASLALGGLTPLV